MVAGQAWGLVGLFFSPYGSVLLVQPENKIFLCSKMRSCSQREGCDPGQTLILQRIWTPCCCSVFSMLSRVRWRSQSSLCWPAHFSATTWSLAGKVSFMLWEVPRLPLVHYGKDVVFIGLFHLSVLFVLARAERNLISRNPATKRYITHPECGT